MIFAALLVVVLLALGLFLYLELDEMAVGAVAGAVILGAVGFAFDLAAVLTILSLLGIGLAGGLGYLVWRLASRRSTVERGERR